MIVEDQAGVTFAVEAAMARTPDPRLREIMGALVRHAHAFVREVRLTEDEFEAGLDFLVGIGQATTATKNEVVLACDVLGVSTLVGLLNNPMGPDHTAAALLGPFWRKNAPACGLGDSIAQLLAKEFPSPIEMVAVNDSFGESGKPEELMKKYGIDTPNIVEAVEKVLKRK